MVEIQFFGLTIESTKLQLFVAAIGVIVAIIFGYLNYKKKSAIASPKTSQFVNDSSGVLQQSYKDVTIAQQTINLNSRENVVSPPTINLHNCIFYIQSMNPNELDKESIVKMISECI